jgi:hypothetical protein
LNGTEVEPSGGEPRGLDVKLPPGLVGNPTAVGQCTREEFDGGEIAESAGKSCPADSDIGVVSVGAKGLGSPNYPIYNLVPPPGVAALFGFSITGVTNVFLESRVRSGGDSGITVHVQNVPQRETLFSSVTIWGEPGSSSHDLQRKGKECVPVMVEGRQGCGSNTGVVPFLTLPTSCGGPLEWEAEERATWQNEDAYANRTSTTHDQNDNPTAFTGCERLVHFEPSISLAPDTTYADTPAGLTATVKVPQGVNPEGLATRV